MGWDGMGGTDEYPFGPKLELRGVYNLVYKDGDFYGT